MCFDHTCFMTNPKNFPVLSKQHSQVAKQLMRNEVKVVLRGKQPSDNLENQYKYIASVFKQHDALDKDDYAEVTFRNYLQSPL